MGRAIAYNEPIGDVERRFMTLLDGKVPSKRRQRDLEALVWKIDVHVRFAPGKILYLWL